MLALREAGPGAGAGRLARLLGRYARGPLDGHVLLIGGPGTRTASDPCRSATLSAVCRRLGDGLALDGELYRIAARDRGGRELRVIDDPDPEPLGVEGLRALLALARLPGAHALVIATGRAATSASASHRAWLVDARDVDTVRLALPTPPSDHTRELLVAPRAPGAANGIAEVKALAGDRHAPVVLLPCLDHADERPARTLREAQVGLQALCGLVAR